MDVGPGRVVGPDGHQRQVDTGIAAADLTPWLEYFLEIAAMVFVSAKEEAVRAVQSAPERVRTAPEL